MTILLAIHRLKDFDEWFEIFKANPPPDVGRWRVVRGVDDPNRAHVIGEFEPAQVDEVKRFLESDKMQEAFRKVNEMSTAPLEFVWLEDVAPK